MREGLALPAWETEFGAEGGLYRRLRAACAEEWQSYTWHPFVQGLSDGTLPLPAFRRYLIEQDALPEATLNASVPVGFDRDEETTRNAAAGFVTPLGTDVADPLERVALINAATKRAKKDIDSLSPAAAEYFSLIGLVPLALAQKSGVLAKMPPVFNLTVSNIVLSKEPLYLLGARLEQMVPISFLVDGYGLNVTLIGYTDTVSLGFVGCRDTIPHLQRLATYTADALEELAAASL